MRRPRRGLSFRAAYTLANSHGRHVGVPRRRDGDDNTPQDSRNLAAEWGPSDFDVRHRLVLTARWCRTARLAGWRIARNWQASAVFTAQSGRPFTPRVSFDNSNTGNVGGGTFAYDRPNVVTTARRRPARAVVPTAGRPSSSRRSTRSATPGRNSLVGPAYAALDAMVSRRIRSAIAAVLDAAARDLQRAEPDELSGCPTASSIARRSGRACRPPRRARSSSPRASPFSRANEPLQPRITRITQIRNC